VVGVDVEGDDGEEAEEDGAQGHGASGGTGRLVRGWQSGGHFGSWLGIGLEGALDEGPHQVGVEAVTGFAETVDAFFNLRDNLLFKG